MSNVVFLNPRLIKAFLSVSEILIYSTCTYIMYRNGLSTCRCIPIFSIKYMKAIHYCFSTDNITDLIYHNSAKNIIQKKLRRQAQLEAQS